MTYLRTNKHRFGQGQKIGIVIIILLIVCFAAVRIFVPNLFPDLFTSFARPFWRMEFAISGGSLLSRDDLLRENQELARRLDEANVRMDTIRAVELENEEIKAFLGRGTTTPRILAAVLARPPRAVYDEIIIDAGRDQGLGTTSKVYAAGEVLIGRVREALSETSKVILYSSPGERYEVLIGAGNVPATAIGRGGGQYEAEVPKGSNVKEEDFVTAPSLSDMPFGVVKSVVSDPSRAFEKIIFAPPVNIYELRWVAVEPNSVN